MHIHYLQHVPFEGPGSIERWAIHNGHRLTRTRLFAGDQFPSLDQFDWLVVMGGPMSIHDHAKYSWLKAEKWFVKEVIDADKPILGICLGAQLVADALGARVYPGTEKEIGWFPIRLDADVATTELGKKLPERMTVFHWHGETFDLPDGATRIASSAVCENQGFVYNDKVIGLQFHLEMTASGAEELILHSAHELVTAPYIQPADSILKQVEYFTDINQGMDTILEYLATFAR